ncbi:MAG TPA: ATP synthase F1 subunit gamma [Candidatus Dojkabacteria bacterium]|nr:ATP synthase F1 subunit gamma [Candidatus Dojkabacteria bacterium]
MSSLRALKRRITTVKNTSQVTKAMQMISASKMRTAVHYATQTVPYTKAMSEIISKMGDISDYQSELTSKPEVVKNILIVIIGQSRGFVGGLVTLLASHVAKNCKEIRDEYPDATISALTIHRKALNIAQLAGLQSKYHFAKYFDKPSTTVLSPIYTTILNAYKSHEYDEIYISYVHFINTMVQKPFFTKLLPIDLDYIAEQISTKGKVGTAKKEYANIHTDTHKSNDNLEKNENTEKIDNNDLVFEPSKKSILDFVLPEFFESEILTAVLDSNASEESARMVAMKNATENAKELSKTLTLQYNQSRQAKITSEILEVASGSVMINAEQ